MVEQSLNEKLISIRYYSDKIPYFKVGVPSLRDNLFTMAKKLLPRYKKNEFAQVFTCHWDYPYDSLDQYFDPKNLRSGSNDILKNYFLLDGSLIKTQFERTYMVNKKSSGSTLYFDVVVDPHSQIGNTVGFGKITGTANISQDEYSLIENSFSEFTKMTGIKLYLDNSD
jgi:hypothetical protein